MDVRVLCAILFLCIAFFILILSTIFHFRSHFQLKLCCCCYICTNTNTSSFNDLSKMEPSVTANVNSDRSLVRHLSLNKVKEKFIQKRKSFSNLSLVKKIIPLNAKTKNITKSNSLTVENRANIVFSTNSNTNIFDEQKKQPDIKPQNMSNKHQPLPPQPVKSILSTQIAAISESSSMMPDNKNPAIRIANINSYSKNKSILDLNINANARTVPVSYTKIQENTPTNLQNVVLQMPETPCSAFIVHEDIDAEDMSSLTPSLQSSLVPSIVPSPEPKLNDAYAYTSTLEIINSMNANNSISKEINTPQLTTIYSNVNVHSTQKDAEDSNPDLPVVFSKRHSSSAHPRNNHRYHSSQQSFSRLSGSFASFKRQSFLQSTPIAIYQSNKNNCCCCSIDIKGSALCQWKHFCCIVINNDGADENMLFPIVYFYYMIFAMISTLIVFFLLVLNLNEFEEKVHMAINPTMTLLHQIIGYSIMVLCLCESLFNFYRFWSTKQCAQTLSNSSSACVVIKRYAIYCVLFVLFYGISIEMNYNFITVGKQLHIIFRWVSIFIVIMLHLLFNVGSIYGFSKILIDQYQAIRDVDPVMFDMMNQTMISSVKIMCNISYVSCTISTLYLSIYLLTLPLTHTNETLGIKYQSTIFYLPFIYSLSIAVLSLNFIRNRNKIEHLWLRMIQYLQICKFRYRSYSIHNSIDIGDRKQHIMQDNRSATFDNLKMKNQDIFPSSFPSSFPSKQSSQCSTDDADIQNIIDRRFQQPLGISEEMFDELPNKRTEMARVLSESEVHQAPLQNVDEVKVELEENEPYIRRRSSNDTIFIGNKPSLKVQVPSTVLEDVPNKVHAFPSFTKKRKIKQSKSYSQQKQAHQHISNTLHSKTPPAQCKSVEKHKNVQKYKSEDFSQTPSTTLFIDRVFSVQSDRLPNLEHSHNSNIVIIDEHGSKTCYGFPLNGTTPTINDEFYDNSLTPSPIFSYIDVDEEEQDVCLTRDELMLNAGSKSVKRVSFAENKNEIKRNRPGIIHSKRKSWHYNSKTRVKCNKIFQSRSLTKSTASRYKVSKAMSILGLNTPSMRSNLSRNSISDDLEELFNYSSNMNINSIDDELFEIDNEVEISEDLDTVYIMNDVMSNEESSQSQNSTKYNSKYSTHENVCGDIIKMANDCSTISESEEEDSSLILDNFDDSKVEKIIEHNNMLGKKKMQLSIPNKSSSMMKLQWMSSLSMKRTLDMNNFDSLRIRTSGRLGSYVPGNQSRSIIGRGNMSGSESKESGDDIVSSCGMQRSVSFDYGSYAIDGIMLPNTLRMQHARSLSLVGASASNKPDRHLLISSVSEMGIIKKGGHTLFDREARVQNMVSLVQLMVKQGFYTKTTLNNVQQLSNLRN